MGSNKPFTFSERKEIERLIADPSVSLTEIAVLINRSKNGVISEVRKHGGRENYTALKAQSTALNEREARYIALSERNKAQGRPKTKFEERISILEMQVEILLDEINKLTKGNP